MSNNIDMSNSANFKEKCRIMDAGTAYYNSTNSLAEEKERVKNIMSTHGYRGRKTEVISREDGVLFMSYDTCLRIRALECVIEEDKENKRFSARFRQTDRNKPLKLFLTLIFTLLACTISSFISCTLLRVALFAIIGYLIVKFLAPSKYCINGVKQIIKQLNS